MKKAILLMLFLLPVSLMAGVTGKLAGTITDAATGEALVAANIQIVGTNLGAASDMNGKFIILNIPPGKYDVECAYIGYQTITMTGVVVQSDQTTALEFTIQEETMELGEEIVVVADRPLVQKDLTSSKTITNAEEIKALPVESYAGVMRTQAGVTQGADGALHIRRRPEALHL